MGFGVGILAWKWAMELFLCFIYGCLRSGGSFFFTLMHGHLRGGGSFFFLIHILIFALRGRFSYFLHGRCCSLASHIGVCAGQTLHFAWQHEHLGWLENRNAMRITMLLKFVIWFECLAAFFEVRGRFLLCFKSVNRVKLCSEKVSVMLQASSSQVLRKFLQCFKQVQVIFWKGFGDVLSKFK